MRVEVFFILVFSFDCVGCFVCSFGLEFEIASVIFIGIELGFVRYSLGGINFICKRLGGRVFWRRCCEWRFRVCVYFLG